MMKQTRHSSWILGIDECFCLLRKQMCVFVCYDRFLSRLVGSSFFYYHKYMSLSESDSSAFNSSPKRSRKGAGDPSDEK